MRKLILTLFICLAISGDTTSQISGSFVFDGITRSWVLHLPTDYNAGESMPLMIALHGLTQTGPEMMQFSDFNTIADTGNFVVVYPNGAGNAWNVGFSGGSTEDDVGFLSALIDTLHQQYNIDLNRVYATGLSNGGFMSYRLACELGNRIAAIAPVAGTMTDGSYNSCTPQREVPVLHIHGTADLIVNYNGGFGNKSVDQVLAFWNNFNNCPSLPVIVNLPDLVAEGSTVQRHTWSPCDESTEVMLLKVINGGHTWPGSVGVTGVGNTNRDIVASSEIWNFVSRFSLDVNTGISDMQQPHFKVYPNPTKDNWLIVEFNKDKLYDKVSIYATDGRLVLEEKVNDASGVQSINITKLISGIYLIQFAGKNVSETQKFIVP